MGKVGIRDDQNAGETLCRRLEAEEVKVRKDIQTEILRERTAKMHTRREAALFKMHRGDAFESTNKLVKAFMEHSMGDVALQSLATEVCVCVDVWIYVCICVPLHLSA